MSRAQHILIVPSWYPSASRPHAGVFIREQAQALARSHPERTFSVYNFQSPLAHLSLKRPFQMASTLRRWRDASRARWIIHPCGLREYWEPFLFPPRPLRQDSERLQRSLETFIGHEAEANRPISLIHAHVATPAGTICAAAMRSRGIPWVLTEHMGPRMLGEMTRSGHLPGRIMNAYATCDQLICVSSAQAALIENLTNRRGVVIPNVVDDLRFTPALASLPIDAPILTVASLDHNKGIDILLHAYACLRQRQSPPPLRIVGDGPSKGALSRLAADLDINGSVTFTGALPPERVKDEMQSCSVFVLPSRSESFGVVLVEALACGRPVVATACGGPSDIVRPEDGILVPCESPQALGEAIADVLSRPSEFPPARLHESACSRFGAAPVAHQLVSLYDSITGRVTP